MFYCDPCAKKCGWPVELFARSRGPCEMCGEYASCNDVHHSLLPPAKASEDTEGATRAESEET